jgi:hypothetical protein
VANAPQNFVWLTPVWIADLPARHFWDAKFLKQHTPQLIVADDRPRPCEQLPLGRRSWRSGAIRARLPLRLATASLLGRDRQSAWQTRWSPAAATGAYPISTRGLRGHPRMFWRRPKTPP